jgi:hypothetical protein
MGIFRKAAWLASGGIVRPTTKKEKRHAELLAAVQGKDAKTVRRAGGRYDASNLFRGTPDGTPLFSAGGIDRKSRLSGENAQNQGRALGPSSYVVLRAAVLRQLRVDLGEHWQATPKKERTQLANVLEAELLEAAKADLCHRNDWVQMSATDQDKHLRAHVIEELNRLRRTEASGEPS